MALARTLQTSVRLVKAFADAGAEWNPVAEAEYFASVCGLVASGAGWSIVDPLSARTFQHLGLTMRDFEPAINYEIGVFCAREREPSILAQSFLSHARPTSSTPSMGEDAPCTKAPIWPTVSPPTASSGRISSPSAIAAGASPAPTSEDARLRAGREPRARPPPELRAARSPCPMADGRQGRHPCRCQVALTAACHPLVRSIATPPGGLTAEVVDLGRGTPEEFAAHAGDLRGRIALVRHELMFVAGTIHRRRKYLAALEAGAVGFLIAGPLPGQLVAGSSGRQDGSGIPAAGIAPEAAAALRRTARGWPRRR